MSRGAQHSVSIHTLRWHAGSVVVTASIVVLWALVSASGAVSPVFLPSPAGTWRALEEGIARGDLLALTFGTVERMFYGWVLASIGGVALGAALGTSGRLASYVLPTLEFLRPLPASAVMPIGIALLGLTPSMVLAVIAFGALWPVVLATTHGFASVEPRLAEVAQVLRLSRVVFISKIGLPNAMPDALAGMRLSLTIALILAVVGEMLASQQGLGTAILLAARSYRAADLFAGVVLLGVIGFGSNSLLLACERRALRWQQRR